MKYNALLKIKPVLRLFFLACDPLKDQCLLAPVIIWVVKIC